MSTPELAVDLTRDDVALAADQLLGCRRLLVLVGAGGSADSGVPTFRDEGGLWRTHRPEDLAHPDAFRQHPEVVWAWYHERRAAILAAVPHSGQRSLALLQRHFRAAEVLVVTTNEDDLLERAGVEPVVHLHGSVFETACAVMCGWRSVDRDGALSTQSCPTCGAHTRPGSVWFGEALPPEPLERIASFQPDGCLVIGSSCLVAPVSQIPLDLALGGIPVIEVNPQETPLTPHAVCLRGAAKDVLPRLVDLLTSSTMRDQRTRTEI